MDNKKNYYLTTAITYSSGKPHIGNIYEIVMSDSVARFKRKQGFNVRFQTGTDEHGQKIELKAEAKGVTPKAYTDEVTALIKSLFDMMNISYDYFIRTTDEQHEKSVQDIFTKFYEQGDIYKSSYEGLYCTPCESFWTASQLIDGKCPDCGRECVKAREEAYFFKMSKYADRLIDYINSHPDFIQPASRKNEMMNNFLLPGLQDLCVSRTTFSWGIKVPFDTKHVVYVWLDALSNYITGLGYGTDKTSDLYKQFWPCDVHIVGKDITRFHTIYWPIFLMALGESLPKKIFAHPWLLQDGKKMSKSSGNTIFSDDLCKFFGVDATRYFLLRDMPYENDGCVSWEAVAERNNGELANVLGNLVSRTVAMINKYFGGTVKNAGETGEADASLIEVALGTYKRVAAFMDDFKISDALCELFNLFRRANKYIDETTPWTLARDESNRARLETVLYNLAESIIIGASVLEPFLPETADKIARLFGTRLRGFDELDKFGLYDGERVAEKCDALFARIDIDALIEQVNAMYASRTAKTDNRQPEKEIVSIDDFAKLDLRLGTVAACEKVAKSDKLLKFTIKCGDNTRTIVSGIAKFYAPEALVGKKVVFIANLKPVKLCGILSEGMILSAENDKGELALLTTEKDFDDGSKIG